MKFVIILIIIYLSIYICDTYISEEYFENIKENEENKQIKQIDYSIKNIIPEININPDAEITFVYVYTSNIYDYCQHSIKNLIAYVRKYNYGLVVYNDVFNKNISPC